MSSVVHLLHSSFSRSVLVYVVAIVFSAPGFAVDYYVNPDMGSNENDGLSPGSPWKSITHALTQIPPSARLRLSEGTYSATTGETFPLTINQAMYVSGEGREKTVIFNPSTSSSVVLSNVFGSVGLKDVQVLNSRNIDGSVQILNCSDFVLHNILFGDVGSNAIWSMNSSGMIEKCVIVQNEGNGIKGFFGRILISDLIIAHGGTEFSDGIILEDPEDSLIRRTIVLGRSRSGITVVRGAAEIRNCLVSGCQSDSVSFEEGARAIVVGCNSTRNGGGIHLSGTTMVPEELSAVWNNILTENSGSGFKEGIGGFNDPDFQNNLLIGNTGNYYDEFSIHYETESEINGMVDNGSASVQNNIVANPLFLGGPVGTNTAIQYVSSSFQSLLTDSAANWQPNRFKGAILYPNITENTFAHYIVENDTTTITIWGDVTDSLFADTTIGSIYEIIDYRLQSGSPAINMGFNPAVIPGETDLPGNVRLSNGTVEIGAYEFESFLQPLVESKTTLIEVALGGIASVGPSGLYYASRLTLPPDALVNDTAFTLRSPSAHTNFSHAIEIIPEVANFTMDGTIEIHFTSADIPRGNEPENMRIHVWKGGVWDSLGQRQTVLQIGHGQYRAIAPISRINSIYSVQIPVTSNMANWMLYK